MNSINLEKKIGRLEKALFKETKARKQAEQRLETYSQTAYLVHQKLRAAIRDSEKKSTQLKFLAFLTKHILSRGSIDDLTRNFISQLGLLVGHKWLADIRIENAVNLSSKSGFCYKHQSWDEFPPASLSTKDIAFLASLDNNAWVYLTKEKHNFYQLPDSEFVIPSLLVFKYVLADHVFGVIVLAANELTVSDEALQTITTACLQFCEVMVRLNTEKNLHINYLNLKTAYQQLKNYQKQLIQGEKSASLTHVSSQISHRLNESVSYMGGHLAILADYLHLLFDHAKPPLDSLNSVPVHGLDFIMKNAIAIVENSQADVERLTEMERSLHTFVDQQNGEMVPVDLADCLNAALQQIASKLTDKYQVHNQVAQNLPEISGHFEQLCQVLVSVLVNAMDAMQDGGELAISSALDKHNVKILIKDNGIGMDQDTQKKMFEPFFSTKVRDKANGLGLTVCKGIMDKHDASIEVTSLPSQGSEFSLCFHVLQSKGNR